MRRLGERHDDRRRQHHDGADFLHPDSLFRQPRARLQRLIARRVLHGMAGLVRRDDDGGQRASVHVLRQQPDDLGLGIVVIAEIGLLHLHVVELHLVQQVPGELAARAGNIRPVVGMLRDHPAHPHLRQNGKAEHRGQNDQHGKQGGTPRHNCRHQL
jgi:hypothetical protein